jgi:hypothetical protein
VTRSTVQLERYFSGYNILIPSCVKAQGEYGGLFSGKNASYKMGKTVTKFQESELILRIETAVVPFVGTIFIKCEMVSDV